MAEVRAALGDACFGLSCIGRAHAVDEERVP